MHVKRGLHTLASSRSPRGLRSEPADADPRVGQRHNGQVLMSSSTLRQFGLTVIEMMVTLAIAGVLLGLALPAFNGFMLQSNMESSANDFNLAVIYARSEAIRRGTPVSVRAAASAGAGDEWGGGFCVVVGAPANCSTSLRDFDEAGGNRVMNMAAPLDTAVLLTFDSRGLLANLTPGQSAVLSLCSTDTNEDPGRAINLNAMGRVSVEELTCHP